MQTIARRDGDEWVITGEKHYTTNGTGWGRTGCQLYTVVCRTDPAAGADDALAVIAVPGSAPGKRVVTGAFSWTAALIGAACVGTMRAAFEYALDFARSEKRLGTVPVIEHQNVGFMLADIKMRIEACRYLAWKACHDFERTGGRAEELAIMTKVYCSEAAVATVCDCMRVIGITSYTKDLAPLERIMHDAMVFPLYDGGNQGVRRRQLHDILRHPGYDSMLAARGEGLPEDD